jgi:hypothetical protein
MGCCSFEGKEVEESTFNKGSNDGFFTSVVFGASDFIEASLPEFKKLNPEFVGFFGYGEENIMRQASDY